MIKFDLHSHTTISDGELTPTELIKLAKEKGLKYIAITDHNTLDGIDEALLAGKKYGVQVIPACELSVIDEFKGVKIKNHLLAYNMDYGKINPEMFVHFKKDRERIRGSLLKLLKVVSDNPIVLCDESLIQPTLRDLEEFVSEGKIIGTAEVWAYAADKINQFYNKKNSTEGEAIIGLYQLYALLSKNDQRYIDEYGVKLKKYVKSDFTEISWHGEWPDPELNMKDAISYVKEAGGLCVVAHPGEKGQMTTSEDFDYKIKMDEKYFEYLKDQGLDGVEVYSPKHNSEDIKAYGDIAERTGLLVSAGTDFHGVNYSPEKVLGCQSKRGEREVLLPFGEVEGLLKKLA